MGYILSVEAILIRDAASLACSCQCGELWELRKGWTSGDEVWTDGGDLSLVLMKDASG